MSKIIQTSPLPRPIQVRKFIENPGVDKSASALIAQNQISEALTEQAFQAILPPVTASLDLRLHGH